ncbi:MAG: DUF4411 family protein [Capsulimonadaceae bacterium]
MINYTVVTDGVVVPGERKKVKVPVICREFSIPCCSLFDMLRQTGAKFVLERNV